MRCQTCGGPLTEGFTCAHCAGSSGNTWVDPYAQLSVPPAQGRSADPYAALAPADAPPKGRPYWLLPVVIGVCVLLVAGVGMAILLGQGRGSDAAEPRPATTSAVPQTSEPEATSPAAPETVFVTLQPTDGSVAPVDQGSHGARIDADAAVDQMNAYLRAVAGNPAAGWSQLTQRRQQVEDKDAYYRYWSAIASAHVSNCAFEGSVGSLACTLTTVDSSGATASSDAKFWLTVDAGRILIDVAGGSGADQLEAEKVFDRLRADSLPLTYDGRWVAELSAKRPGISDPLQVAANGTHVFYLADIVALHESFVARLPGTRVLALRRADWGKQGRDLWQSVADPGNLADEAAVEAWCATVFPELSGDALHNQCTPRQLTPPHS